MYTDREVKSWHPSTEVSLAIHMAILKATPEQKAQMKCLIQKPKVLTTYAEVLQSAAKFSNDIN